MLKNIPSILNPELLKILMEMGHGDEIVIADGNFPAASNAKRLVGLDGHSVTIILEAVLMLFPLDTYVDNPVALMSVVNGDNYKPIIWDEFRKILGESGELFEDFELIEKFEFYERSRNAYAVIASGEKEKYANIILKKGVL